MDGESAKGYLQADSQGNFETKSFIIDCGKF
jgi:hypothetical protein